MLSQKQLIEMALQCGLPISEQEPINHTGPDTQTQDLPAYSAEQKRRKQICALLVRLFAQRDKRVKKLRETQEVHRALREGETDQAEPVQSADDTEQAPTKKRKTLKFKEWRRRKGIVLNPTVQTNLIGDR